MNHACELAPTAEAQKPSAHQDVTLDLAKISRAYSSPPWWYDLRGFFILTLSYRATLWSEVSFFARNIRQRHLEVAIGSGTLFKMVLWYRKLRRQPEASIVGMDYAETMLAGARKAFASWRNVEIYQGDVCSLKEPDGRFLSVNIANAFHAFSAPEAALAEVHRVLAPGGTMAMNVMLHPRGRGPASRMAKSINAWAIRKGILATTYHAEDARRMLTAAGFKLREERISGNNYTVVAAKKA